MHYNFYLSLGVYKRELLINDSCALIPGTCIKLIRSETNIDSYIIANTTTDEFPYLHVKSRICV